MAVDVAGLALEFIDTWGLYAIFVLLVMDGALMLPVFPGELVLVMAVAAYVDDIPSLIFLILLASLAGLLGSLILYGVTRGGGRRLVERFPRFFMMPRKRRERLEKTFQRPAGQSLVFFLRLVPLTRVLVNIPAGLAKMPIVRFLVLSTIGLLAYHAGFLWFSYEVQREGSALATQKEELEAAYASPAMEFVEANAIITGAALLVIGAVLSLRASRQMFKDPEESGGSLIGWAATVVLFWGGLALGAATYLQPESVIFMAELGGVDVEALARQMGVTTLEALFGTAGIMVFFGLLLRRINGAAQARRRRHVAEKRAMERLRADAAVVAAIKGAPAARPAERDSQGRPRPAGQGGPAAFHPAGDGASETGAAAFHAADGAPETDPGAFHSADDPSSMGSGASFVASDGPGRQPGPADAASARGRVIESDERELVSRGEPSGQDGEERAEDAHADAAPDEAAESEAADPEAPADAAPRRPPVADE